MSSIPLDLSRANCRGLQGGPKGDSWENASTMEVPSTPSSSFESLTQLSRSSIEGPGAMGDTDIVSSQFGN